MVVLKKVKASTLMETLVATVLVVVVFVVASMVLNNLFANTIQNNTREIEAHMNELQYRCINQHIKPPHYEDYKGWNITLDRYSEAETKMMEMEAVNESTQKSITKQWHEVE